MQSQSSVTHRSAQTETAPTQAVVPASLPNPCTTVPVKSLQVSMSAISMAPNSSTSFQACTQYAGPYTITASPANQTLLTFPRSVNPIEQPNTIELAAINITSGAGTGTVVLTVRDKKGNVQRVTVNIAGPLTLVCPALGNAGATTLGTAVDLLDSSMEWSADPHWYLS